MLYLVLSCVERDWDREYLPPFVLRVTDSDGASRLCRTRRQTHNKDFDFKTLPTMIHEGLHVSVVLWTSSSPVPKRQPRAQCTNGVYTKKYEVMASRVIDCVSVTHARTHDPMLLSLQFFSSSSLVEFSIKVCLLFFFFFASIYFTLMARKLIEANVKASPWDNGSKEPCPRTQRSGHGRIRTEDRRFDPKSDAVNELATAPPSTQKSSSVMAGGGRTLATGRIFRADRSATG